MTEPLGGGMPMTTALELPGVDVVENLGLCFGLVVRSMGFAGSIASSFTALLAYGTAVKVRARV